MNRRNFIDGLLGFAMGAKSGKMLLMQGDIPWVRVSNIHPEYFVLSDGRPFVVNGSNISWARDMDVMKGYLENLSVAGGNFARVWLCHWPFEIENRYGIYDEDALKKIDLLLSWAVQYRIRLKFCLENTRQIVPDKHAPFNRSQYHLDNGGPFRNIDEYINTDAGRKIYLDRLAILSERYRDVPTIFGWELWNEMNGIRCGGLEEWNNYMLPQVQKLFPHHLVMQSLGSFDSAGRRAAYQNISSLASNAIGQIHRYLDEGAELMICKAPVDQLASDAVGELRSYRLRKPVLLAETGAVQPHHAGPSDLYSVDKSGVLLHDMLFAPFFSGAAGSGNPWHWDEYIDRNGLWYHFGRFANAVSGVNVIKEGFQPERIGQGQLRLYVLKGNNTILIWCRDSRNDWRTELRGGVAPEMVSGAVVDCSCWIHRRDIAAVDCYDPWTNGWTSIKKDDPLVLPDFQRSTVIRIFRRWGKDRP